MRFAFMGRLVDWKRVDLLLEALAKCPPSFHLRCLAMARFVLRSRRRRLPWGCKRE